LHADAVEVVEAGFQRVGPNLLDRRGKARRPKLGMQALGNLLADLAGQTEVFGGLPCYGAARV
jgi:hypothetical protein